MYIYAQLNQNDVCIGISQLSGEVESDKLVRINSFNEDFLWKRYDRETLTWSEEKYEPESNAPLSDFERLQQQVEQQNLAIAELSMLLASQGGSE